MSEKVCRSNCATVPEPVSYPSVETVQVKFWPPQRPFVDGKKPSLPPMTGKKPTLFMDFVDTVRDLLTRERRVGFQKPK